MKKVSLNLMESDLQALDEVARRHVLVRRHAVARAALRAGLSQMIRDDGFAVEHLALEAGNPETSGGAK